eukprot:483088-Pelagomonas_calceolata.AAC.1
MDRTAHHAHHTPRCFAVLAASPALHEKATSMARPCTTGSIFPPTLAFSFLASSILCITTLRWPCLEMERRLVWWLCIRTEVHRGTQ